MAVMDRAKPEKSPSKKKAKRDDHRGAPQWDGQARPNQFVDTPT